MHRQRVTAPPSSASTSPVPQAHPAPPSSSGRLRPASALSLADVLHLQRAVGNRAVAGLLARGAAPGRAAVLQRWSVAAIDAERDRHKARFGGAAALHHIVSKSILSAIATEMARLGGLSGKAAKPWEDAKEKASAFQTAVFGAWRAQIGSEGAKQTSGNLESTLHNLPFNLEAGPEEPLGDPGTGVDVVTTATAVQGGGELRTATPVSAHLAAMAERWRLYELHKRQDDRAACAADLEAMTSSLTQATGLHTTMGVATPIVDQWFDHEGRKSRKKAGTYFGTARGTEKFRTARNEPAAIPEIDAPLIGEAPIAMVGGETGTVRVVVDQAALTHAYRRHSYAHFDFDDIKLVNVFFPHALGVEGVPGAVTGLATRLAQWLAVEVGAKDWDDLDGDVKTYVTADVFAIGKWEQRYDQHDEDAVDPISLDYKIRTIAPQKAENYTASELTAIGEALE